MSKQGAKIYTRTGDGGKTSLFNGERTSKSSIRVNAIGDIDEINCLLGVVIANSDQSDINEMLLSSQHALFNIGSNLAARDKPIVARPDSTKIESMIDDLSEDLPLLTQFILPGGSQLAALCHLARAVCRRAERHLVELQDLEGDTKDTVVFVNRLSDLLFVIARAVNHRALSSEVNWDKMQWQEKD